MPDRMGCVNFQSIRAVGLLNTGISRGMCVEETFYFVSVASSKMTLQFSQNIVLDQLLIFVTQGHYSHV